MKNLSPNNITNFTDFSKGNIHFIGIAGMSMRSLAEIMLNSFSSVSGTDKNIPIGISTEISCFLNSDISQVPPNTSLVVINKSVPKDHPDLVYAKKNSIPIIPRIQLLNQITENRPKILVTGTDGKTSTSYFTYQLCKSIDPFLLIGAEIEKNKCYHIGKGPYIVEHNEADLLENLDSSDILIFTNFDGKDHIWCYEYNYELFFNLYATMVSQTKYLIYNSDEENIEKLLKNPNFISTTPSPTLISFGTNRKAQYRISNIDETIENLTFDLTFQNKIYKIKTFLNGKFSAYNVTAAIIASYVMEYKFILNNNDNDNDNDNHLLENIIRNCEFLKHTESRFEVIYQDSEKLIVNSIHNSGNSLKQVIESYKKYNKPISVLLSIDIPGSDRGEVFFEEFMEAVENIPIAFLSNSLLAKKAFQNRSDRIASSTIISNQEDFNQFIYNISGICIVSHTKFCFHKYLKNSFSNFQSCFYV